MQEREQTLDNGKSFTSYIAGRDLRIANEFYREFSCTDFLYGGLFVQFSPFKSSPLPIAR